MSTRSGKRIHGPEKDSPGPVEVPVVVVRSERKTRSKKQNENVELPAKKRNNYVSYPGDYDITTPSNVVAEVQDKGRRKTRRNTLKELNDDVAIPSSKSTTSTSDNHVIRKSRRGKQLEESPSTLDNIENTEVLPSKSVVKEKKKDKKKKNKKKVSVETNEQEINNVIVKKKGGKKKKKSNSLVFTEEEVNPKSNAGLNKSNCSVDSFHSAAGSPEKAKFTESVDVKNVSIDELEVDKNLDVSFNNKAAGSPSVEDNSKVKASFDKKNISTDHIEDRSCDNPNTTFEKKDIVTVNSPLEKEPRKRRKSSIKNSTFDKNEGILEINVNTTFEKDDAGPQNSTYDMDSPKSKHSTESRFCDNAERGLNRTSLRISNCKISNTKSPDTTFDKDSKTEMNATFDKTDTNSSEKPENDSKKSSLISSDGTVNITDDKSAENSRISITSDESRTENILNATPVLIESSIDDSHTSDGNKTPEVSITHPSTPLKREGTFTKDDSNTTPAKTKLSVEVTPRRKSLPSPGCTPFPLSKSSQKKSVLNVTRSIEKPTQRPSLADVGPKQTKVMFCSPVNNPAIISQVKGRVIKSNLKGSNKSFVLEDSVVSESRPTGRKRSHTHNDVETRAKRKRLADDLQSSVDRLSRPRTLSAAAKLTDPGTPPKKAPTPSKAKTERARTKLPNFAALHQKQFARMESLDECQRRRARRARAAHAHWQRRAHPAHQPHRYRTSSSSSSLTNLRSSSRLESLDECQRRRARRARALLTPTGSVGLIQRTSPTGTTPTPAPKPTAETKEAAKLHTPSKPKLPTIESLNPGYTRFGFKLNIDVNPFSTTTKKTETKPKEKRPNGLSRQTTCLALPSLEGTTATRKDVAKQTVMREKSFTERRDVKRKENRTVIKGVRTNRRFELQMKMRNINA